MGSNSADLTRLTGLAYETGEILSTFPTSSFPEQNSTRLIIPSDPDQKPTIQHRICVAYKYSAVGGVNNIEVQEGEEVEGERQIELSFSGHTTGGFDRKVIVTTTKPHLEEGLRKLIGMGREAGGETYLKSYGQLYPNNPPSIFYPDYLP